jgi:hypothetical protein
MKEAIRKAEELISANPGYFMFQQYKDLAFPGSAFERDDNLIEPIKC